MRDIEVYNSVARRTLLAASISLAVTLAIGLMSNVSAQNSGNWAIAQAQQAVKQQISDQARNNNRGQNDNNRAVSVRFNNDVQTQPRPNSSVMVRGTGSSSSNNNSYNDNYGRRREFSYEALVSNRGRNRNGVSNVSEIRYDWRDEAGDYRRGNGNDNNGRGGYRGVNRPEGRISYSGPIMNRHSDKGLDVIGSSSQEGANIQQWGYSNQPNQNWDLIDLGNGEVAIINRNSGMALTVQGGRDNNGANIIQRAWNDNRQQRWRMEDVSNGYFKIVSVDNGKCLDVSAEGRQDGANIQVWDYANQANQQWRLRR